jgi:hypothetical protein
MVGFDLIFYSQLRGGIRFSLIPLVYTRCQGLARRSWGAACRSYSHTTSSTATAAGSGAEMTLATALFDARLQNDCIDLLWDDRHVGSQISKNMGSHPALGLGMVYDARIASQIANASSSFG